MNAAIDDVAKAAGVSTATVSRALRDLPGVRPQTRARVREEARRLGYAPSASASSLASGRTRTIAVLTPWIRRWFHGCVTEGIERTLRGAGFDALLYSFERADSPHRTRLDPIALRRRVDGVLVVGMPVDPDEEEVLNGLGVPVVFVGAGPPHQCTVTIDDGEATRAAMSHLLELGHRTIALVTARGEDQEPWGPPAARQRAYQEALASVGVAFDERLVVPGEFGQAEARERMVDLLRTRPDVTAVFAISDDMAFGVLQAAREVGRDVPQELSVVGIDGHDMSDLVNLTTVHQDAVGQGAAAAGMLLEAIAGGQPQKIVTFPTHLVVRGTTAPPRR
ncbi:MAG TPA: LacI family DNA-binding transcriptional regulator [Ruania sp.]|nr:LacI family DNA-binding transcriptional regulator [Ruania sp.]